MQTFKPLTNVRLIAEDLMLLVQQEVRLARQEIDQKVNQAFTGLILAIAGLFAGFIALGVLVQTAVAALAVTLPLWGAALLVGAICTVAAVALLIAAYSRLNPSNLAPTRTIHSISQSAQTVKENIK